MPLHTSNQVVKIEMLLSLYAQNTKRKARNYLAVVPSFVILRPSDAANGLAVPYLRSEHPQSAPMFPGCRKASRRPPLCTAPGGGR